MPSDFQHPGFGEQSPSAQAGTSASAPSRLRPYQGGAARNASDEAAYNGWQDMPESYPPLPPDSGRAVPSNGRGGYEGYERQAVAQASVAADPFAAASAPAAPTPGLADSVIASGLHKAINAVRGAIPLVQRLLPLFEGNVGNAATAITALVAPTQPTAQHMQHPPAAPPAPPVPVAVQVDLEPIERGLGEVEHGLVEVRTAHRELRTQVAEQTTAIKRFEGQMEHVREATDRNTLEQQELVEDIRAVGSRVSTFAIIGLVLLAISLLVNLFLVLQMQRILR